MKGLPVGLLVVSMIGQASILFPSNVYSQSACTQNELNVDKNIMYRAGQADMAQMMQLQRQWLSELSYECRVALTKQRMQIIEGTGIPAYGSPPEVQDPYGYDDLPYYSPWRGGPR